MEALTAVAVAALTIYDMVKAVDKTMVIGDIRLDVQERRTERRSTRGRIAGSRQEGWKCNDPESCNAMNILVGVISPAPAWVLPRQFVDQLRRDFPQHTFLDAWDRDTLRRLLPEADVAFTPFVDRDIFPSASRLRWVQSPAVGVGSLMFPELLASPVVITSARGIRARAIAEHVLGVTIALARQLPSAMRAQVAHRWAQDELEGATVDVRTLAGTAHGHRRARRDRARGREDRRAVRVPGLGDPPARRTSRCRTGVEDVWPPDRLHDLLAQSDVVVLALPHHAGDQAADRQRELDRDQARRAARERRPRQAGRRRRGGRGAAGRPPRRRGAGRVHREPLDPASPYWDLPNVIVTPHTSGAMQDYWTPLVALFAENLRRFEEGRAAAQRR